MPKALRKKEFPVAEPIEKIDQRYANWAPSLHLFPPLGTERNWIVHRNRLPVAVGSIVLENLRYKSGSSTQLTVQAAYEGYKEQYLADLNTGQDRGVSSSALRGSYDRLILATTDNGVLPAIRDAIPYGIVTSVDSVSPVEGIHAMFHEDEFARAAVILFLDKFPRTALNGQDVARNS